MGSAVIGGWGTGHAGGIDIPLADPGARAVCRRCHREVNAASVVDGLCMTCRGRVAEPGGRIPDRLRGVCPECGKTFRKTRASQKFCSAECGKRFRQKARPKPRTCARCGREFMATHAGRRYCSPRCAEEGHAERMRRRRREVAGIPDTAVCPECGREFRPEHGRKTCSPECARARNRRMARERSGERRGR
jgi:ribosomal protein S27AE